jgi:hypothetical protein
VNRLSFSRQPSAYIGLISAGVAFAAVLGLHAPQGFEAAAAGFITAVGAAFTWTQVRPAATSVEVKPGTDVIVHEQVAPGITEVTEHRLMGGKVAQIGKASAAVAAKTKAKLLEPKVPVRAHPAPKTAKAATKKAK